MKFSTEEMLLAALVRAMAERQQIAGLPATATERERQLWIAKRPIEACIGDVVIDLKATAAVIREEMEAP